MNEIINVGKRAIILQKPSGIIAIAGNMDIREQKFYNGFLKIAKEAVLKDHKEHWFNVSLNNLKKVLNVKEQDKNNSAMKKIIKKMHKIDVEYNVLEKDKTIEGYASLLDNIKFITDKKTGGVIIKYSIPEEVRLAMVRKGEMYASINLVIIKGLRSKYSVRLYELSKDYQKVEIPKMTIKNFRKIFGVDNKYPQMPNLRKWVLDRSCDELNRNSNINFIVKYKLIKHGNICTDIKFYTYKKPKSKITKSLETQTISPHIQSVSYQDNGVSSLIDLIPAEHLNASAKKMIIKYFKEKDAEYVQQNIQYTINSNPKNFVAYLSIALKENYGEKSETKQWIEIKAKEEKEKDKAEENKRKAEYEKYEKQYEELSDEKLESLIYKVAVHSHLIRKQIKNGAVGLKENSIVKARIIAEMIKNGANGGSKKNKKEFDDQAIRNQRRLDKALGNL